MFTFYAFFVLCSLLVLLLWLVACLSREDTFIPWQFIAATRNSVMVSVRVRARVRACVRACVRVHVYVYVYACVQVNVCTLCAIKVHKHVHTWGMYTQAHTKHKAHIHKAHTHTHTQSTKHKAHIHKAHIHKAQSTKHTYTKHTQSTVQVKYQHEVSSISLRLIECSVVEEEVIAVHGVVEEFIVFDNM